MTRKSSAARAAVQPAFCVPIDAGDSLLAALFSSSTVGVAICDRQLRFDAINDALASMNGIPAEAHLGKTLHTVLGSAADKVQPAFEHVFATGQPLSNCEVSAKLPTRGTIGHWSESYFPIKDHAGAVRQVGAVVLELTEPKAIEASLVRLNNNLARVGDALRVVRERHSEQREPALILPSAELLEDCFSATRAISHLLHSVPNLPAVPRLNPPMLVRVKASDSDEAMNFTGAYPVEDEEDQISLSSRERTVVALLAAGNTNKEIAAMLAISTRTVETHRARIMLKLDLHSVTDIVRYALRARLIQP
jgi:DNA-binding CsgD family transcriptional regulator